MGSSDVSWQEGRAASERIYDWRSKLSDSDEQSSDSAALRTLADIKLLRADLDELEVIAVQVARGRFASWGQIASKLGLQRQTVWKRWKDLGPTPALGH